MRQRIVPGIVALPLALACAGTAPGPTQSQTRPEAPPLAEALATDSPQQQELATAMLREADPLAPIALDGPDESFHTLVPARLAGPMRYRDGRTLARLDIGASSPVECTFFAGRVDLGAVHYRAGEAMRDAPALQARQLAGIDAGALGDAPWTAVAWLYRIETPDGASFGMLKQRAVTKDARSVYCQHDEVGYTRSFARLFESLVANLAWGGPTADEPAYTEVSVAMLEGRAVGVQRLEVHRNPDATAFAEMRAAVLLPKADDQLEVHDSLRRQQVSADGSLVSELRVQTQDGSLRVKLLLDRETEGGWRVRGRQGDRAIDQALASKGPVTSIPGQQRALRVLLEEQGVGGSMRLLEWLPASQPAAFVTVETRIERAIDGRGFLASSEIQGQPGPAAEVLLDASGAPLEARIPFGGTTVEMQTVFVAGAP